MTHLKMSAEQHTGWATGSPPWNMSTKSYGCIESISGEFIIFNLTVESLRSRSWYSCTCKS